MNFYVLRQQDERSSELCKELEDRAIREGGLTFPLTHDGYFYDMEDVEENLGKTGKYYTNLFHSHCRCHLAPVTDENTDNKAGVYDDVDVDYIVQGSAGYLGRLKMASKNPGQIETFVKSKMIMLGRWFSSRL